MLPVALLSTLLASTAVASSNYTFPSGFDLGQVKSTDKAAWCTAERNSCPKICGGVADSNSCDPSTLDFTCKCSNGSDANVALYTETVPYFVCQANFGQCIDRASSLDDDEKCKEAQKNCGSLNASESTTSSSSTSSATSLPTSTSSSDRKTSSTGSSTTSSTASASTSNAAVRMVQDHATGVLATALFVGLRLVL